MNNAQSFGHKAKGFVANLVANIFGTLIGIAFIAAFIACIAIVVMSFFASTDPLQAVKFSKFCSLMAIWLPLMSVMTVLAMFCGQKDGKPLAYALSGLSGFMLLRVGPEIAIFPEIAILAALLVAISLVYAIAGFKEPTKLSGKAESRYEDESNQSIQSKVLEAKRSTISFVDVAGMDDLKSRLLEAGQEIVMAHRKGEKARNGILLTGKPGNGKTYMAEALAGELNLPFMTMTFGDVSSKWIGDTTERVVQGFREAKANAPCVLFLDEVDSLLGNRESSGGGDEAPKTTNAILTELVNIRRCGVVVMAASNYINKLDPAAIREGRFDFKIEIPPPDEKARFHLIKTKANRQISHDVIEIAVRRWAGFSVARISAIMDELNRMAGSKVISFAQMKVALRTIQGRNGRMPEGTPVIGDLVMGQEHKEKLQALATRMDRIADIEAMGGSVPRGVLFYGPAGTGKTLTARALAKTAQWAFLSVSGLDLMSKPERIDAMIEEASDLRPCVVFIDEADDVFADRRMSSNSTITNKLLAVMDGAGGELRDVLFIAATNHPGSMDSASLRGGRFTEKIEFALPDAKTILHYIEQWSKTTKAKVSKDLPYSTVASMLEGNPIANIKEILQMAINNAIMRIGPDDDVPEVSMLDIEQAIESVAT